VSKNIRVVGQNKSVLPGTRMERREHVQAERLVRFLLEDTALSPAEHEHFVRCKLCQAIMVSRASEELTRRREGGDRSEEG
jgi:hypothetical protein